MTKETFETINRMQEAGTMRKLRFVYFALQGRGRAAGVEVIAYMKRRGYSKEVICYLLKCCHAQYEVPELIRALKAGK